MLKDYLHTFNILQIAGCQHYPHVVFTNIWRFPGVRTRDLKPLEDCSFSYYYKKERVCVNPFHYQKVGMLFHTESVILFLYVIFPLVCFTFKYFFYLFIIQCLRHLTYHSDTRNKLFWTWRRSKWWSKVTPPLPTKVIHVSR